MKKNIEFILLFLVIVWISSCKNHNKKEYLYSINTKDYSIPIANDEYPSSFLTNVLVKNDTTYLFRKSAHSNFIYIYNWDIKKRINKIEFKDFGPNRIVMFNQSSILPFDNNSFFIGSVNSLYFTKHDSIIKHIKLKKSKINNFKYSGSFFIFGSNSFPAIRYKDNIICYLSPANGRRGSSEFFASKLLFKYNISNGEYKRLNVSFPYEYKNKCWSPNHESISYTLNNKNKLILLFKNDATLYKYDLDNERITDTIKFESNYASKIKPIKCGISDKQKIMHFGMSASYEVIKYDSYKDIYYVIVQLPLTKDQINSVKNPFTLNPFSLIVLDNSFNILVERKFEGGIYNYLDFFVTKEGLWLSKNSPHNPNFDENKLRFSLINIIKNEN